MKRNLTILVLSVVLSTVAAVLVTNYISGRGEGYFYSSSSEEEPLVRRIAFEPQNFPDFTYAAENCVDAVVFVKVVKREKNREASILEHFFGYGNPYSMPRESVNSGSGVIISI